MANTTEMTGIHGRIYLANGYVPAGICKECKISFERTEVVVPPGCGGTAEKSLPGSMKNMKITAKTVLLTTSEWFARFFGGTPSSSSSEALKAETEVTGSVMEDIAASANPSAPSFLQFTAGDGDTVIPDDEVVRIAGTDASDNPITEEIVCTTGAGVYTTGQVFKTVSHIEVSATFGDSGDTNKATVKLDAMTGTITVAADWATTFTFKVKVQNDAEDKYMEWNMPNTWILSYTPSAIGPEEVLMNDVEMRVKDTSAVTITSTLD